METLYSSLAFCAMTFFLGIQKKISFLYCPFLLLGFLILTAYAGSYAYILPQIKLIFLYAGLLAGIVAIILGYKKRNSLWQDKTWKEEFYIFILFVAILLCYNWYYAGSRISDGDDFFHAAYVKALFYDHGFWTLHTPLARSDMTMTYPPMPSLLAWIFQPTNTYTEAAFGVSIVVLMLSASCILYAFARQHLDVLTSALLVFIITVFLRIMGARVAEFYLTGHVDIIQGTLFGIVLCSVIFLQEQRQRLALVFMGLVLLALCKSTGIVLCLYVSVALALQKLLYNTSKKPNFLPALAWFCISFVVALVPYWLWKVYVAEHLPGLVQASEMLNLKKYFNDPLLWPAFNAYLQAFYNQDLIRIPSGAFPVWLTSVTVFTSLTFCGVLLAQWKIKKWKPIFTYHFVLLFCGLFGWICLHFYSFFVFAPEDRIMAAGSFHRYIGVFMSGAWSVFLLLFFSFGLQNKWKKVLLSVISVFLIIVTLFPLERPAHTKMPSIVLEMQKATSYLKEHTQPNSLILFIPNLENFLETWALRYYLAPDRKAEYPYFANLQPSYNRAKSMVSPLPPKEEFLQKAKDINADYIFVFEEKVLKLYPEHFEFCEQKAPCLISLNP